MTAQGIPSQVADVIETLRVEIAALFDGEFRPEAIRTNVDVFAGEDDLVEGFTFDSLDLVKVIALVEDVFDVSLGLVLADDGPVTLATVAAYIAGASG